MPNFLDIQNASVSDEGVEGFYWPVPIGANHNILMSFYADYTSFVRSLSGTKFCDSIRLTHRHFFFEVVRLFEMAMVLDLANRDAVNFTIPDNFPVLKSLRKGVITQATWTPSLEKGPPRGRMGPVFLKRIVRDFGWNVLSPSIFQLRLAKEHVAVPSVVPLILSHAKESDRTLRFTPYPMWFESMPPDSLTQAPKATGPLVGAIEAMVLNLPWPKRVVSNKALSEWIRCWLGSADVFVDYHLGNLRKQSKKLPSEVWFGAAAGTFWSTILAQAVRESGGLVVSHSHGGGSPQVDRRNQVIGADGGAHIIYTYNETQADILRRDFFDDIFTGRPTEVRHTSLRSELLTSPKSGRTLKRNKRVRKIMYVATAYHGMRFRGRPIFPDIVVLDLQARLFGKLRKWGYQVIYKPHPEGASKSPQNFAERFGFEMETRCFEDIHTEIDAYLVDFVCSSTTSRILKSDKPVFHINLPYPILEKSAEEMLRKRCVFIDAEILDSNRIEVDWGSLHRALEKEEHEWSMLFPDTYYANV